MIKSKIIMLIAGIFISIMSGFVISQGINELSSFKIVLGSLLFIIALFFGLRATSRKE